MRNGGPIKVRAAALPDARLGGLTSKAGMSFSFMGIILATPRSIKDSDGGREAAENPTHGRKNNNDSTTKPQQCNRAGHANRG